MYLCPEVFTSQFTEHRNSRITASRSTGNSTENANRKPCYCHAEFLVKKSLAVDERGCFVLHSATRIINSWRAYHLYSFYTVPAAIISIP